jgi:hypothetical protein
MKIKKIFFSGDSFTWGESIELENRKYIELLRSGDVTVKHNHGHYVGYQYSHFHDISSESNSIQHRINNRYSTLVSKHFDCIGYVNEFNGGSNFSNIEKIINFEKSKSKIDLVVIQLSYMLRDIETEYQRGVFSGIPHCNHENIETFIDKVLPMWEALDTSELIKNNIPSSFLEIATTHAKIWSKKMILDVMKYFQNDYEKWWLFHYIPVYEKLIKNIEEISNNIAPVLLIGSWSNLDIDYEKKLPKELRLKLNSFKVKINGYENLYDYIKNTKGADYTCSSLGLDKYLQNHHPTIKTHKEIAKSLISEIESRKLL